jgi:hypothetical protein
MLQDMDAAWKIHAMKDRLPILLQPTLLRLLGILQLHRLQQILHQPLHRQLQLPAVKDVALSTSRHAITKKVTFAV